MTVDNSIQILISIRLLLSFVAGMLIGYDRERSGKAAGLRTQMLVCVGSALFTGLSLFVSSSMEIFGQDPTRIMAQIVSGVGFLGAGVILKNGDRLSGVTTAATIWTSAAVGVAIGSGFYIPAGLTVLLVLMMNPIAYLQYALGSKGDMYAISFSKKYADDLLQFFTQHHIRAFQKSIRQSKVFFHLMSTEQKNEKLIEYLGQKGIRFSLEPADD